MKPAQRYVPGCEPAAGPLGFRTCCEEGFPCRVRSDQVWNRSSTCPAGRGPLPARKDKNLVTFATDEARARVGIYWKMGQIITICFDFNGVNKCQIGQVPLALQTGSGICEIPEFMEMTQNIMQPKQRFAFFLFRHMQKILLLAATVRSRWQITIWSDK